jgi:hypothetical protein
VIPASHACKRTFRRGLLYRARRSRTSRNAATVELHLCNPVEASVFLQSIGTSHSTRIGSVDGGTNASSRSARPANHRQMLLPPYCRTPF